VARARPSARSNRSQVQSGDAEGKVVFLVTGKGEGAPLVHEYRDLCTTLLQLSYLKYLGVRCEMTPGYRRDILHTYLEK
jgi:hypothetical protein